MRVTVLGFARPRDEAGKPLSFVFLLNASM